MPNPLERLALAPTTRDAIQRWLTEPAFEDSVPELQTLVAQASNGDPSALAELDDAFCRTLPIGTGGRRGTCGPGPNRMNTTVLRETAFGLADAMRAQGVPSKVAVVFDTRRDSRRFAKVVANALVAEGIDVVLVDEPRATPLLSHMVRARECGAGVVISASHNPPGDNGIKIYGPDGAQVLGARDKALMDAIEAVMRSDGPRPTRDRGVLSVLDTAELLASVDEPYLAFVGAQGVADPLPAVSGFGVAYTPLHGVGHTAVVAALETKGVKVTMVDQQAPDGGAFATVRSANPELPSALEMVGELAKTIDAPLALASDPDADRLGALARDPQGTLTFIDGNRLGVLMLDHVLRHDEALPADGWVLTTVVTSPLIGKLARAAGVEVVDDLLVGFKHHAGMMAEQPHRPLIFGTEESHGYIRGNDVHDKDAAIAAVLLTEAAAVAHARGETLFARLDAVWREHGYHREKTANIFAHGSAGREAIAHLTATWRNEPPQEFGGLRVTEVEDRVQPRHTGSATRDLPSNVLIYTLAAEGGQACRLVLRPSGTEPKVKVYALVSGPGGLDPSQLGQSQTEIDAVTEAVLGDARQRAAEVMAPRLRG